MDLKPTTILLHPGFGLCLIQDDTISAHTTLKSNFCLILGLKKDLKAWQQQDMQQDKGQSHLHAAEIPKDTLVSKDFFQSSLTSCSTVLRTSKHLRVSQKRDFRTAGTLLSQDDPFRPVNSPLTYFLKAKVSLEFALRLTCEVCGPSLGNAA